MDSDTASSICDACMGGLTMPNWIAGKQRTRHQEYSNFMQSAGDGCILCTAFLEMFDDNERQALSRSVTGDHPFTYFNIVLPDNSADRNVCWVQVGGPQRLLATLASERNLYRVLVPCSEDESQQHVLDLSGERSERGFDQISEWITTCDSTHDDCRITDEGAWYPMRLLDVRPSPEIDMIKLLDTAEVDVHGRYLTLSHCWGAGDFLKLESSTQALLHAGITTTKLPQTFRDAIEVVRALRERYLWIDSICIMQDDLSDWLAHSEDMGRIYSSAFCNIAADASTSSHESFFRPRDLSTLQRSTIEIPETSTAVAPGKYLLMPPDYPEPILKRSPANKRGWVLQERILARRVIHFTDDELVWECRTSTATELFPFGTIPPPTGWLKALCSWTAVSTVPEIERRWAEVVEIYSSTQLTFLDDRPAAISGVAKLFEQLLDDQYILGMWGSTLIRDLTWRCRPSSVSPTTTTNMRRYRPPSFSWLSVDREILPGSHQSSEELVEVIDIDVKYVTNDRTGLAYGGSLRVKGKLRYIVLPAPPTTNTVSVKMVGDLDTSFPMRIFPDTTSEEIWNRTVLILPLVETWKGEMEGLILEPLNNASGGFRRIGLFSTLPWDFHQPARATLRNSIEGSEGGEHLYPCEEYYAESSSHVICIE